MFIAPTWPRCMTCSIRSLHCCSLPTSCLPIALQGLERRSERDLCTISSLLGYGTIRGIRRTSLMA